MNRFRLVALAVVLASAFWLAIGVLWLPRPARDEQGQETVGGVVRPVPRTSGAPAVSKRAQFPGGVDSLLLIPIAGARADDLVDNFAASHGIDLPGPLGMPVIAAAPGIVEKLSISDGKKGNAVYVRSPDRTRLYRYTRLGSVVSDISEGQVIGAGEQLGSVGSSRLRFEVLAIMPDRDWSGDARAINPYPLLGGRQKQSR